MRGRVAAYAWGADYHEVLDERLKRLVEFIEGKTGRPLANRRYTDSGPLLERELAQRAGLGWIGKNTCLINPEMGSYFLLAEVLLDLELDPDPPFEADRCGSCTRCLEACPTHCILPDRTLDARRCISYLTIELKDDIPDELRPQMGNWVFGCDLCQQVCPWNMRFAAAPGEYARSRCPNSSRDRACLSPRLVEELALTQDDFNLKFKGSPVRRAKRRGYLRNVAVALGNSGDPTHVPALNKPCSTTPSRWCACTPPGRWNGALTSVLHRICSTPLSRDLVDSRFPSEAQAFRIIDFLPPLVEIKKNLNILPELRHFERLSNSQLRHFERLSKLPDPILNPFSVKSG